MIILKRKKNNESNTEMRVTIVLKDENNKKLRDIQAKQTSKSQKSISFSNVVNQMIEKGLKN